MKKTIVYIAISLLLGLGGCSDFGNVNNDPEHLGEEVVDYRLVFTGVEALMPGDGFGDIWRNAIIYCANMLQHTATVGEYLHGTFYLYDTGFNESLWGRYQEGGSPIRNVYLCMKAWKDKPGYENEYQMARIVRVFLMQRMTDQYGDVPYSEASKGTEGLGYPKYDKQEDIYNELLKELDEAQAALDPLRAPVMISEDVIYGGDAAKWKKLANSLMVRVAMRLSKVDPGKAEIWVKKALINGVFDGTEDNAILPHTDGGTIGYSEPYGEVYAQIDTRNFFLSEYFVNLLKESNDPRLALISTVCTTNPRAKWTDSQPFDFGDCTPEIQVGMPIGYDQKGGNWDISKAPGYPGKWSENMESVPEWAKFETYYSRPNRYTYSRPDAPSFLVTHAETQLLLAEAAYRGWITDKTAEFYYNEGVKSAMEQFSAFTTSEAQNLYKQYLNPESVQKYLDEHPFDASKAFEQINTQYYITTFCDEYETFSNWRRSGYPVLTPVDKGYPLCVTNGSIPRRFTYPTSEPQVNAINYNKAVSELKGGDKMTSRVWWDKK